MPRHIELHVTSQQGRRPSNEDVEVYRINLGIDGRPVDANYAPVDCFIVCDGHGGSEISNYVAPKLLDYLTDRRLDYPLNQDQIFRIFNRIQQSIIKHPRRIGEVCGSTTINIIRYQKGTREYIQAINLGDCRAVLSRRGLAVPLTKDHKPIWPEERMRIDNVSRVTGINRPVHYDAGDWRVHDLSVSRAFGDIDATPHVTHIPDSFIYSLQNDDEFIIIACDGLWDTIQNHEAINFISDHIKSGNTHYYDIPGYPSRDVVLTKCLSRKLASYAIARGSTDNVSILTVIFGKR